MSKVEKLETIPENAYIYEQVKKSLLDYQSELKIIDNQLKTEEDAQQLLNEADVITSRINKNEIDIKTVHFCCRFG